MKIGVCVKGVPEEEWRFKLSGTRKVVMPDELQINPYDEFAVEEALKWKDMHPGTEVVVFLLGPDRADKVIYTALGMGADRAVHVVDEHYTGIDCYQTAKILKEAIGAEQPDWLLTGKQSTDLNNHQVGPMLAELLGWTQAMDVNELYAGDEPAKAVRMIEKGKREVVLLKRPMVIGVTKGLNSPRYPSFKNILAAKRKEIKKVPAEDLPKGKNPLNSVYVEEFMLPPQKGGCRLIGGGPREAVNELIRILRDVEKVI